MGHSNKRFIVKVLVIIGIILYLIVIVFLSNALRKSSLVSPRETESIGNSDGVSKEDFDTYEDYLDYIELDDTSFYAEEGRAEGLQNKVFTDISNLSDKVLEGVTRFDGTVDYNNMKSFNVNKQEKLGISSDLLNFNGSILISESLEVVGLVGSNVIFGYNFPENKELVVVSFTKEGSNFFGTMYSVGDTEESLFFNTENCVYKELDGYEVLFIKN